jgi:hypothetical protein
LQEELEATLQFFQRTIFISTPTLVIIISNFEEEPKVFTFAKKQPPKTFEQTRKEEEKELEEIILENHFFKNFLKKNWSPTLYFSARDLTQKQ